ncbi:MAG: Ig-like domain-containing protein [Alloprevotella sp.]|nr:Ig-like domain-containing protein [Alloprevotella sp.]
MKSIKRIQFMLLAAVLAMPLFTACGDKEDDKGGKVTEITFPENEVTLYVGATYVLHPTFKPADAPTGGTTYKSDNTNVVTVTNFGEVTAVSEGTANITCQNGKVSAKVRIVVTSADKTPGSVKTSRDHIDLKADEEGIVNVGITPAEALQDLECTSDNEAVFEIVSVTDAASNTQGYTKTVRVKGIGEGSSRIVIKSKSKASVVAYVRVNVSETYDHKKARARSYLERLHVGHVQASSTSDNALVNHYRGAALRFYNDGTLIAAYQYTKDYAKDILNLSDTEAYNNTSPIFAYTVEYGTTNPFEGTIKVYDENRKHLLFNMSYSGLTKNDIVIKLTPVGRSTWNTTVYYLSRPTTEPKVVHNYQIAPWQLLGEWYDPDTTSGKDQWASKLALYTPFDLSGTIFIGTMCGKPTQSYASSNTSYSDTKKYYVLNHSTMRLRIMTNYKNFEMGTPGSQRGFTFENVKSASFDRYQLSDSGTKTANGQFTDVTSEYIIYDGTNIFYQ